MSDQEIKDKFMSGELDRAMATIELRQNHGCIYIRQDMVNDWIEEKQLKASNHPVSKNNPAWASS